MRIDPRLLSAIVLSLLAAEAVADEAIVVARDLAVFDRPENGAFEVGSLAIGTKVVVVDQGSPGMPAIEAPKNVFNWIDENAIRPTREPHRAG